MATARLAAIARSLVVARLLPLPSLPLILPSSAPAGGLPFNRRDYTREPQASPLEVFLLHGLRSSAIFSSE
jgi:hypothetical protein